MRCFPDLGLALAVGVCAALTACGSSNIHEPSLTADAQLQVAEAADASGDSELAISKYSAAAASEPSNIGLQLRCADALARYGKITQARQLLTERLRTNHDQPDLIRALALVDLVAGAPNSGHRPIRPDIGGQSCGYADTRRQGRGTRFARSASRGASNLSAGACSQT